MIDLAVAVGCSQYDDPDIGSLQFAHRDAESFARAMVDVGGLEQRNVWALHDGQGHGPTRTAILRQLTMLKRLGRDQQIGTLFFFFSGHGYSSGTGEDFLLPSDSLFEALTDTSLHFDLVLRLLRDSGARHVLLFLDACRAAVGGGKTVAAPKLPLIDPAVLSPPGMVSFSSCEPGEVSYEADGLQSGVFTAAVLEALSDVGRCTTVYELDTYLLEAVPRLATSHGRPPQHAHTRVEPLGIASLEIVSPRKRGDWHAGGKVGQERRQTRLLGGPQPHNSAPLVGIDFGTSYSAVAWYREGDGPQLIPSPEGRTLVPSVVTFVENLDYYAGWAAVSAE